MKLKNVLLAFLTLSVLVIGCKKDDEPSAEEVAKNRFSKTWNITKVTLSPNTDYNFNPPVTYTFGSDGTFTSTNAEALPKADSPQRFMPATGTWAFQDGSNYKTVLLKKTGETDVALTITALEDNKLVVTYDGAEPKETDQVTVTVEATPAS